eukprot:GHVR01185669.1.p1 GENE.GHVR01185669.1~~GHVR01185669.1.p1  ORF type:complete len:275 (-),score=63.89 GHVR01185669.1:205-1029(-)
MATSLEVDCNRLTVKAIDVIKDLKYLQNLSLYSTDHFDDEFLIKLGKYCSNIKRFSIVCYGNNYTVLGLYNLGQSFNCIEHISIEFGYNLDTNPLIISIVTKCYKTLVSISINDIDLSSMQQIALKIGNNLKCLLLSRTHSNSMRLDDDCIQFISVRLKGLKEIRIHDSLSMHQTLGINHESRTFVVKPLNPTQTHTQEDTQISRSNTHTSTHTSTHTLLEAHTHKHTHTRRERIPSSSVRNGCACQSCVSLWRVLCLSLYLVHLGYAYVIQQK